MGLKVGFGQCAAPCRRWLRGIVPRQVHWDEERQVARECGAETLLARNTFSLGLLGRLLKAPASEILAPFLALKQLYRL